MDREAPGLFTASERIIQDFAREKKVDATFIKDLIQKVLHHPDFDPDDVDHDMHERLMAAIEEGDLQIIDLKEHGDGEQDVRLFKRPAGKVLRELLADPRLAGCQHFAFKQYKDADQGWYRHCSHFHSAVHQRVLHQEGHPYPPSLL